MMNYGVAYYPEHWGKDSIENDARLMKELNFNVVRMGEFAWTKISPEEDIINLEWLDEAIEKFANYNIKTIMCTPTACPPKYLMDRYPDIYSYDERGIRRNFGSRRSYCFNSKSLLEVSRKIAYSIAKHYSSSPNVISWQIDNELGGDSNTRCYCENCKKKFRLWLTEKYQTIDVLNAQWGTDVWSQVYRNFEEIDPPMYTNTVKNPSACLEYKRFCSDSAIKFMDEQIKIIKSINPKWLVTTNCFGIDADIDYKKLSQSLDFLSWDDYPNLTVEKITPYMHAMGLDTMRGHLDKEICCMETQSGTPGGDIIFQTPRPGDMRKWVMQSIAHGANSILYFRWRTNYMGAEQYWHGIINHDGIPRRLFHEAKQISDDIIKLEEFCCKKAKINESTKDFSKTNSTYSFEANENSNVIKIPGDKLTKIDTNQAKNVVFNEAEVKVVNEVVNAIENEVENQVAIVLSQDVSWAFNIQPLIIDYSYIDHIKNYYKAIFDNNIAVDIISPASDYGGYKLIIFPNFIFVNEQITEKIKKFTSNGGTIITDFRSFVKEYNNKIIRSTLPCGLNEVLGIEVWEYGIISKFENVKIKSENCIGIASDWYEMIKLKGSKQLAEYECNDYYHKYPVITKNKFGSGIAYYFASTIDDKLLYNITKEILLELDISPEIKAPVGVEIIKKQHMGTEVIFVINHSDVNQEIMMTESYYNIITSSFVSDKIDINPNDVLLISNLKD